MRPKLLVAAAFAALLACVPLAGAASPKAGTFKGKTDRDQPVRFKVTKGRTLTAFSFRGVVLRCNDGERMVLGRVGSGRSKITITPNGKFSFSADYKAGDRWSASGTIDGRRAKGKLRFRVRFDSDGNAHPQGETVCDTGTRRFEAELR
jgi:hypothetical protein